MYNEENGHKMSYVEEYQYNETMLNFEYHHFKTDTLTSSNTLTNSYISQWHSLYQ